LDRNGFKSSESGFDTNETNPFLSISIYFRLLGCGALWKMNDQRVETSQRNISPGRYQGGIHQYGQGRVAESVQAL